MNWQSIETAPLTGRVLLVVSGRVIIGQRARGRYFVSDGDLMRIGPSKWAHLPEPPA